MAQGQHIGYGAAALPAGARGQHCQAAPLFSSSPKYRAAGGPHHLALSASRGRPICHSGQPPKGTPNEMAPASCPVSGSWEGIE